MLYCAKRFARAKRANEEFEHGRHPHSGIARPTDETMPCAVRSVNNYFQESFVNKYTRKNRGLFFPFRAEFALRFTLFEPLAVSSSVVFNRFAFHADRGKRNLTQLAFHRGSAGAL